MNSASWISFVFLCCITQVGALASPQSSADKNLVALGKALYFDTRLSQPSGMSCATCHNPETGFAHTNEITSVAANGVLYGSRNTPSLVYSHFAPKFTFDKQSQQYVGGMSWDGRFDILEEQSASSITERLEMGNKDIAAWFAKIETRYPLELPKIAATLGLNENDADIGLAAIAAYIKSSQFAQRFNAKYDKVTRGELNFTASEKRGLILFEGKAQCASCHTSQPQGETPALFTNHGFENIGVPRQTNNLFYYLPKDVNPAGQKFVDGGLANNNRVKDKKESLGKFKVPSLRNVAATAPYMHNGAFQSLQKALRFHANRLHDDWVKKPETTENLTKKGVLNQPLSSQEIGDLVAFLKTLTDD